MPIFNNVIFNQSQVYYLLPNNKKDSLALIITKKT